MRRKFPNIVNVAKKIVIHTSIQLVDQKCSVPHRICTQEGKIFIFLKSQGTLLFFKK